MPQIEFTFRGEPHEFRDALIDMGLMAPAPQPMREFSFGDNPAQLRHGTPDGKPATDLNVRSTEDIVSSLKESAKETSTASEALHSQTKGPHSPEEVREALAETAKEEASTKRKEAAARKASKAEEKRKADAAARVAAAITTVGDDQSADPNGASLEALLSPSPETEIPEHLTETAKADEVSNETGEEDLSALLGDGDGTPEVDEDTIKDVEQAERRQKFEAMDASGLNAAIRELMKKKGVPWLKSVLAEAKKPNLAQLTQEEMIEVLVRVD